MFGWYSFGERGCEPGSAWRGRWDFDPGIIAALWGGSGRGRWGGRGGRVFDQGDLKYVVLKLLDEKPRHGYEIIKELEERSGGLYSPSPGTVYPTLTMLEDLGYARAVPGEGGRRIYEITAEGREYLASHRSTVDDLFERIAQVGASFFGGGMRDVHQAFKHVGRATYTAAPRHAQDAERLRKIAEALERAAREIEELAK